MRYLLLVAVLVAVIGCRTGMERGSHEGTVAESDSAVQNQNPDAAPGKPSVYPGAVGVSGGQSGTGTTSGASTGY